ncbi:MAG: transporter substrate-binding domain-containing protein [Spirochaetes bacterium]|nr:transporter substrate-binding domain-containing protein [Spirochaetota bacterium]
MNIQTRQLPVWFQLITLLCSIPSFFAVQVAAQEIPPFTPPTEITVGIDDNYPPFSFRSPEGRLQGLLVDLWEHWSKITGTKVTLSGMDWGIALEQMRAGRFDVIDTIFKTPEREGYLDFSSPYKSIEVPIFFHRDISGIASARDLQGFVVGVKKGDAVIGILQEQGVFNLKEFLNYESIAMAAKLGTIRVFSIDKPPALYFLHKYDLLDEFRSTLPLYTGAFHRAVRKGNLALLAHVEGGFKRIPSGVYERLEEKWYGRSLRAPIDVTLLWKILAGVLLVILLLFLWIVTLKRAVKRRTWELEKEKEYVSSLFNSIGEGILLFDVDGTVLNCNRSFERLIAFPLSKFLPLPLKVFCNEALPYSEEKALEMIRKSIEEGPQQIDWEARHRKGHSIPVEVTFRSVTFGEETKVIASVRDISQRLRYIEALTNSLKEKEALMRELVHRTKNNLQLVSSLLSLYLGNSEDAKVRTTVRELQNRIASIATVHQMLCATTEQIESVNLKPYLEQVLALANEGFHLDTQGIVLSSMIESILVPPKIAVVIGLVVNELVINAVKHAFPVGKGGTIQVTMRSLPHHEALLEVADSGNGFPPGFDPRKAETIGFLTLYNFIEQQLKGSMDFYPSVPRGLTASIRFPLPNPDSTLADRT